jgi:hypothetical protein
MNQATVCNEHSGVCANWQNNEKAIMQLKSDTEKDRSEIWKAIDGMRAWVVAGMGSLVLAMGTFIITNISSWIK